MGDAAKGVALIFVFGAIVLGLAIVIGFAKLMIELMIEEKHAIAEFVKWRLLIPTMGVAGLFALGWLLMQVIKALS